ncbi:hypothetical protein HDU67_009607 [Dinochytrium kinnereticum]|nr:hypothetical protein HDU67_009607 [Dinochytrium kinnereticum]
MLSLQHLPRRLLASHAASAAPSCAAFTSSLVRTHTFLAPASLLIASAPTCRTYVTNKSPIQKPRSTKTIKIYKAEDPATVPLKENLPYDVKRTALAQWLPIYREYRNQGTNISTIIRRISGDVDKLAKDLEVVAPPNCITVRKDINQIRLRGDYLTDLREFFTVRKF